MIHFNRRSFGASGVIFCAFFTFAGMAFAGTYSGGSGTAADPYKISKVADWQELIATSTDWDKNFILINDIDFGGINLTPVAPDTNSNSIGFQGTPFRGTFDGRGYALRNAVLNLPYRDYVGIFGCLDYEGQIQKLGLENMTVTGRSKVGGLVGSNDSGTLVSCYSTGTVIASLPYYSDVGGLVGENWYGSIISCYADSTVDGIERVGGLVGSANYSSTLTNCYAAGFIRGYRDVGGLVGCNEGKITTCTATGTVSGSNYIDSFYIGGLVGYTEYGSTITSCYAIATISGDSCIGGLVGRSNGGTIGTSYAFGTVSGVSGVGGLLGSNSGTLTSCYAGGFVSGSSKSVGGLVGSNHQGTILTCYAIGTVSGPSGVSGLVGSNDSEPITACFWDIQTSGQTGSSGGKGLTTQQMKTLSIYQNAGWAGKGWVIQDGVDYPRLSWENSGGVPIPAPGPIPLTGSGTANDPYRIFTADEFAALSWYSGILDKQIQLTQGLDLKDVTLYPIGDLGAFTGVFEGDGYTLNHVLIHQPGSSYVGLFSYLGSNSQVRNLFVDNATITGQEYVGSIVGWNRGVITACSVNATVTGSSNVGCLAGRNSKSITSCSAAGAVNSSNSAGGLTGPNDYSGTLTNCYATAIVSGVSYVGGLASGSSGPITDCCATGTVSGSDHVGGLVGGNDSWITASYALGTVIGSSDSVGGLVGLNHYSGTLTNCHATGAVSGNDSVGGLVGTNNHSITSCYATGAVNGFDSVGGIAGYNIYSGILMSCYATGFVSGSHDVGGLVGRNVSGTIMNGCATGAVSGSSDDIGGLVGWNNSGAVSSCLATGTVLGSDFVGGLVGLNFPGTITSSYATGGVTGFCNDVGGLVGRNIAGTLTSCYAVGTVRGSDRVGGLVGYSEKGKQICERYCDDMGCWDWCYTDPNGVEDPSLVQQSFWDTQQSKQTSSSGGTGKAMAEMKALATFTGAGWDFVGESANGTADIWRMCADGVDYPRLAWEFSGGGDFACPDLVGLDDLLYLAGRWLVSTPETVGAADGNGDGKVDMVDLAMVSENWMRE